MPHVFCRRRHNTSRCKHNHNEVYRSLFILFVGVAQVRDLEFNDSGHAYVDGPNEEMEPLWASDELDIRVFVDIHGRTSL